MSSEIERTSKVDVDCLSLFFTRSLILILRPLVFASLSVWYVILVTINKDVIIIFFDWGSVISIVCTLILV